MKKGKNSTLLLLTIQFFRSIIYYCFLMQLKQLEDAIGKTTEGILAKT